MPAVKWFALYAAVSLTLNFIMQITCFVAAMSIDEQRRLKPSKQDDTPNTFSSESNPNSKERGIQNDVMKKISELISILTYSAQFQYFKQIY